MSLDASLLLTAISCVIAYFGAWLFATANGITARICGWACMLGGVGLLGWVMWSIVK